MTTFTEGIREPNWEEPGDVLRAIGEFVKRRKRPWPPICPICGTEHNLLDPGAVNLNPATGKYDGISLICGDCGLELVFRQADLSFTDDDESA